ncbi:SpaA isopeptide-forming pilin-related protein [Bifidobacterium avesanii]|uniref:Uncharacterized protein n=1 Tax=Bifidobacterium avesanii TaxID=1798157 RepID=A0A7K3THS8_9BIFI|nr:SdrD B-like domain-containing protein [Bifidobacterium avesanii]KAB8291989.1 SdrD B-like domain-containing protein [Bifidobacterium avesanii]NEG78648.1 hypothetical protein [Bifidobacterium avesanii]
MRGDETYSCDGANTEKTCSVDVTSYNRYSGYDIGYDIQGGWVMQWSREQKSPETIKNTDDNSGWINGQPDASAQAVRVVFNTLPSPADGIYKIVIPMRVYKNNATSKNVIDTGIGWGPNTVQTEKWGRTQYVKVVDLQPREWSITNKVELYDSAGNKRQGDTGQVGDTAKYTVVPKVNYVADSAEKLNPTVTITLDPRVYQPVNTSNNDWDMKEGTTTNASGQKVATLTFTLKGGARSFDNYGFSGDRELPAITYDTTVKNAASGGTVDNSAAVEELGYTSSDRKNAQFNVVKVETVSGYIAADFPTTEIKDDLKWTFNLTAGTHTQGYTETVIKMPSANDGQLENALNLNEYTKGHSNKDTFAFNDVELDNENSSSGVQIFYSTQDITNASALDPNAYSWSTQSSANVKAIKVRIPYDRALSGLAAARGTISLKQSATSSREDDKYAMWIGGTHTHDTGEGDVTTNTPWPDVIGVVQGEISGVVWWDANNNTYKGKDADGEEEPGIGGVTLHLTGEETPEIGGGRADQSGAYTITVDRTTTTDPKGNYSFGVVHSGTYTVTVVRDKGDEIPEEIASYYTTKNQLVSETRSWLNKVYDNAKPESDQINLAVDGTQPNVDFGFYAPDPKVTLDKQNKKIYCPADETKPCEIQWDVTIRNEGNTTIAANTATFSDRTSDNVTITDVKTRVKNGEEFAGTMAGQFMVSSLGYLYQMDNGLSTINNEAVKLNAVEGEFMPGTVVNAQYGWLADAKGNLYYLDSYNASKKPVLDKNKNTVKVTAGLAVPLMSTMGLYTKDKTMYVESQGRLFFVSENSAVEVSTSKKVPEGFIYVVGKTQAGTHVVIGMEDSSGLELTNGTATGKILTIGNGMVPGTAFSVPDSPSTYSLVTDRSGKLYRISLDSSDSSVTGLPSSATFAAGMTSSVEPAGMFLITDGGGTVYVVNASKRTVEKKSQYTSYNLGADRLIPVSTSGYITSADGALFYAKSDSSGIELTEKISGTKMLPLQHIGRDVNAFMSTQNGQVYRLDAAASDQPRLVTQYALTTNGVDVPLFVSYDTYLGLALEDGTYYTVERSSNMFNFRDRKSLDFEPPIYDYVQQKTAVSENGTGGSAGYVLRTYDVPTTIKPNDSVTYQINGTVYRAKGTKTWAVNQAWFDAPDMPRSGTPTAQYGEADQYGDAKSGKPNVPAFTQSVNPNNSDEKVITPSSGSEVDADTGDVVGNKSCVVGSTFKNRSAIASSSTTASASASALTGVLAGADASAQSLFNTEKSASALASVAAAEESQSSPFVTEDATPVSEGGSAQGLQLAAAADGDEHTFGSRQGNKYTGSYGPPSEMREDSCDQVAVAVTASSSPAPELGSIAGYVWWDVNKDGSDLGEYRSKSLEGIEVYLLDAAGNQISKTVTTKGQWQSYPSYKFTNLPVSAEGVQYYVQFSKPELQQVKDNFPEPGENESTLTNAKTVEYTKMRYAKVDVNDGGSNSDSDACDGNSDFCVTSLGNKLTGRTNVITLTSRRKNWTYVDAGVVLYGPSIRVEKFIDLNGNDNDGQDTDGNVTNQAEYEAENNVSVPLDVNGKPEQQTVTFVITNTGDEDLKDVNYIKNDAHPNDGDKTVAGSDVTGISCPPYFNRTLAVGDHITCVGTLQLKAGEYHEDTITVSAVGVNSGSKVSDTDGMRAHADIPVDIHKLDYATNDLVPGAEYTVKACSDEECATTTGDPIGTIVTPGTDDTVKSSIVTLPIPRYANKANGEDENGDGIPDDGDSDNDGISDMAGKATGETKYYRIEESRAPDGYLPTVGWYLLTVSGDPDVKDALAQNRFSFTAEAKEGAEPVIDDKTKDDTTNGHHLTISTTDPTEVKIKKIGEDGQPLAGAKFTLCLYGQESYKGACLTDSAGKRLELETASDGTLKIAKFPNIASNGLSAKESTYVLTETVAPTGMMKLNDGILLYWSATGGEDGKGGWVLEALDSRDKVGSEILKIKRVSVAGPDGQPVVGAKYKLCVENSEVCLDNAITTDANGEMVIDKLPGEGDPKSRSYTLTEQSESVPEGVNPMNTAAALSWSNENNEWSISLHWTDDGLLVVTNSSYTLTITDPEGITSLPLTGNWSARDWVLFGLFAVVVAGAVTAYYVWRRRKPVPIAELDADWTSWAPDPDGPDDGPGGGQHRAGQPGQSGAQPE